MVQELIISHIYTHTEHEVGLQRNDQPYIHHLHPLCNTLFQNLPSNWKTISAKKAVPIEI